MGLGSAVFRRGERACVGSEVVPGRSAGLLRACDERELELLADLVVRGALAGGTQAEDRPLTRGRTEGLGRGEEHREAAQRWVDMARVKQIAEEWRVRRAFGWTHGDSGKE
ncbi:hypothetical protein ERJ75_000551900 [Trypanosoma vivax]|nr:hypothetical protein ERJ75_000551900 [Trypanosoma vivax]